MRGTRTFGKIITGRGVSARIVAAALGLTALFAWGGSDRCRADGRLPSDVTTAPQPLSLAQDSPRAGEIPQPWQTSSAQQLRQFVQAQGYVGDAPPEAKSPAKAQAPPKDREEEPVGSVKARKSDKPDEYETINLDFKSVSKALDLDKHEGERGDVRDHWRALKGSRVSWHGKVYRVSTGWRGYKILLMNDAVPTDEKYNIVLTGRDRDEAKDIDDDDELWFKGVIDNYKAGKGERGTIVTLTDGDIKKKKSR